MQKLTNRQREGLVLLAGRCRVEALDFGRRYWPDAPFGDGRLSLISDRFLNDMYTRGYVLRGSLGGVRVYDISDSGRAALRDCDE